MEIDYSIDCGSDRRFSEAFGAVVLDVVFDIVFRRGVKYLRKVESPESLKVVVHHTDTAYVLESISMMSWQTNVGCVGGLTW